MSEMAGLRRHALLCVAALAALVLAGCAAGPGGPEIDDLAQVADASASADTASFELTLEQELGSQTFSLSADGAFDTARKRARLALDLSSIAELFSSFGAAFGAKQDDLEELGDPAKWRLEAIQDGTRFYVSSPLFESALPAGKTWISGDLEEIGRERGFDLGQVGAFGKSDPRDMLDVLRAASGDLEVVGEEEIRGVSTTHYRTTLDADELRTQLAKTEAQGVADGFADSIASAGLKEVPIDVWVDEDSLLRRLEMSLTLEQLGAAAESSFSMDLFDYGEPVDVTPPPPAQVADVTELQKSKP
jgi:LppX_LprAFG lipoprotein